MSDKKDSTDERSAKDKLVAYSMLGMAFRDAMNVRALEALAEDPDLVVMLTALRLTGKANFTKAVADQMVRLGILSIDFQGYYISEIVEDAVDKYLQLLEEDGA